MGSFFLVFGRDMKFNSKSLSSAPRPCFPAPLHGRAPAAVQGPQARAGSSEHAARAARAVLHLMQGDRLCAVHGRRGAAGDGRWQGTVFSAGHQGAEQRQDPWGGRCNMAWCDACMGQGWHRASSRPGAAGHVRGRPGPCPVARHASSAVPMSHQRPASAEATGRESGYLLRFCRWILKFASSAVLHITCRLL